MTTAPSAATPLVATADAPAYEGFVRAAFSRGLRAVIAPKQLRSLADTLGFDADAAPRDLDAYQWAACSRLQDSKVQRATATSSTRARLRRWLPNE